MTSTHWLVLSLTLLISGMAIGLHYETLQQLNRRMPHWSFSRHPRVLAVRVPGLGQIVGVQGVFLLDAVYASATAYTTLGYGDLVPRGAVRFLVGTEALVGLLMITWSASFAYLEMQRYWRS